MTALDRRQFLGSVAAMAAASTAGCSVLDGGSGGGGGVPDYADWIPASMASVDDGSFQSFGIDLGRFDSEFPEQARQEIDVRQLATDIGVEMDDLDEFAVVQTGMVSQHSILTGSFSGEDVVPQLSEGAETSSYEGFEVIQDQIAVDDGTIVISPDYRSIVDAGTGNADSAYEQDGEWRPAFENVAGGTFTGVVATPNEDFVLMGIELNATGDGDRMQMVAYMHFPSADEAEANMEGAGEDVGEGDETWELVDISVDGNVIVVEGETENLQF
jgi:hypothetical protein